MQKIITIHGVGISQRQVRPQGDPAIVYIVNAESSDGPLVLEFSAESARHMSAHLTSLLPEKGVLSRPEAIEE